MSKAAEALRQLLSVVERDEDAIEFVRFVGDDPVLQTRFLVGSAGAAALAAVGVAVSDLWALRGGRRQKVAIDLSHAGAALRSSHYLRVDGGPPPNPWDGLSGFYRTKDDRYIQLHTNFPHHHRGTVALLGTADERDAVAEAIAGQSAATLEQAMADAGLCAAMVRTRNEWFAHAQGVALRAMPLLDVVQIGDSDPEPLAKASRPLTGIRCLDLTRVLAGPTAGRTLAEHGADVLRVASPHLPSIPSAVMDTGHGKRSTFIDFDDATQLATLRGLTQSADIFCDAYRPGSLAQRGLAPGDLAQLRPGIVCVSLSAYGSVGPWAARRGYDTLVQSASGMALEQGGGKAPKHTPCSALDYVTGYLAAFGAITALCRRALYGGSYQVRVSLAQTAAWLDALGRAPKSALAKEVMPDVSGLLQKSKSPFGELTFLGPVLSLSDTPPSFASPSVPLGTHPPEWMV